MGARLKNKVTRSEETMHPRSSQHAYLEREVKKG